MGPHQVLGQHVGTGEEPGDFMNTDALWRLAQVQRVTCHLEISPIGVESQCSQNLVDDWECSFPLKKWRQLITELVKHFWPQLVLPLCLVRSNESQGVRSVFDHPWLRVFASWRHIFLIFLTVVCPDLKDCHHVCWQFAILWRPRTLCSFKLQFALFASAKDQNLLAVTHLQMEK